MKCKVWLIPTLYVILFFGIQFNVHTVNCIIGLNIRMAEENEIPYIVSFMRNTLDNPVANHFCAGVLVTSQHVLSTAHCTIDIVGNQTVVLAGTNNLVTGRVYYILWTLNFAQFSRYKQKRTLIGINDISTTKLTQAVDNSIVPAFLCPLETDQLDDAKAIIVGWGVTNNNQKSQKLLVGEVKILSLGECESRIKILENRKSVVNKRFVCSMGEPYVQLHNGDWGGPLISEGLLVGINKETRPPGTIIFKPEKVNIHINLEYYTEFISQTTSDSFHWPN